MTGKRKPVDPYPIEDGVKPNGARRHPGFSKETVDAIYDEVLIGGTSNRSPKGQFSKGVSGNPKGRPKLTAPSQPIPPSALAADSLSAIVQRQGARKIKAQTDQGEVELTLAEAAMIKTARESVRGNTGHSRTFFNMLARAESEDAKLKRELFRHWSAVKEQATELYRVAEQAGDELPLSVDPADIELHPDGTVSIVGPTDAGEIAAIRCTQSLVDYHVVNIAYQRWIEKRWIRGGGQKVKGLSCAEVEFWGQQATLPPRLKMSIDDLEERLRAYRRFSGRVLHGFLREKAQHHGLSGPPREARIPLIIPIEMLEFAKENKISALKLVSMSLDTNLKLMTAKLDEIRRASGTKPEAES